MPRPSFQVKDEHRKLVRSLAALGLRQDQIAGVVGVRSPKTLRKHFRAELKAGFAEAKRAVVQVAYEMALSGRYPQMTIFWDKCNRPLGEKPEPVEEKPERRERGSGRSGLIVIDNKKVADVA